MNAIEAALEGRIGKPPTMRTGQSGKPWCSFSVAVGGDDNGGATWVGVSAFGSQAEALADLAAGARVYVEGRLKLETWTDGEGRERTGLKLAATLVQPMGQIGHRKPAKARGKASGEDGGAVVGIRLSPFRKPLDRRGATGSTGRRRARVRCGDPILVPQSQIGRPTCRK